jgi:mRNA-degrading endonuclease RelE of RelBE toxin-antitoxin system
LEVLRTQPDSGKALKGELAGWRSFRVGRFRIVYRPLASRIDVAAIGPRASIYFETARLLRRGSKRHG